MLKQNNLHIQAYSFQVNVLNDDNNKSIIDVLNETLNNNFEIDDEKFLENWFAAICNQNEKYQGILMFYESTNGLSKNYFQSNALSWTV